MDVESHKHPTPLMRRANWRSESQKRNHPDSLSPLLCDLHIDDISKSVEGNLELRNGEIAKHLFNKDEMKVTGGPQMR